MTIRIVGFLMLLLACSSLSTSIATAAPQVTELAEPSGPKPSATVEALSAESNRLAEAKQLLDALRTADQALESARQGHDIPGTALAQQARAKTLQNLQRTDEALAAWQEAARLWAQAGDGPGQITALVQAGLLCVSDKRHEAEKFFAQGLSIGKSDNPRPRATAKALYDSGVSIGDVGLEQPAMDYLVAAMTIRERSEPESLEMIDTLNALAKYTWNRGVRNTDSQFYSQAKDYATRAVAMAQRLAPDSSLLAESLRKLALYDLDVSNDVAAARERYHAALGIQKKVEPGGSMLQAEILHNLGEMEAEETNFAAAHEYLEEAVAVGERLAPESKIFEGSLEALGNLEVQEGNLAAARDHLQRALGIKERLHANLGGIWVNLGNVASNQYDFAAARDYYEKALAFFAKNFPNTSGIPIALEGLSETFREQRDLATALEYGRRALARDEEKLGVSPDTARDLSNVGAILQDQGKLSEAADYYRRALDMWQQVSAQSLHVSGALSDLAKLARAQGNARLAMDYDRRALEMGQKSCANLWCVTGILNDLGQLAYEQGDLAGSENYLRKAVDLREKSLGAAHPDLARSLNSLALTLAAQGETWEALADALQAEKIGTDHLRVSVRTLSERQALAYGGIRASGLDLALTLASDQASTPWAHGQVFDAVIHSRALIFDELAARHRSAYGSGDPEVTQLANQLSSARAQLATLVFRGPGDTPPEAYRKLLDDAREKKEKAEQMLAQKSLSFRQDQARVKLGLKEIAASLPQGTALVAFVRYAKYDLQKPDAAKAPPEPVPSYAAFVLQAGAPQPEFVPLGAAQKIESLLAAWRQDVARQAEVMDVFETTGENTYRHIGSALGRRIWDPLVPSLGDAKEVFVVPDAALHLVNLAALPVAASQYLVETGPLIHYLSTERDLVPAQSRRGEGILVVGNPAFDHSNKAMLASNQQPASMQAPTGEAPVLLRGSRSACGTFQSLRFSPLPASQREADNIAALWKKTTSEDRARIEPSSAAQSSGSDLLELTGGGASPEAFEQYAPGKRVLHVATHGFFLEGTCESAVQRRLDANKRDETFLPATAENPLLLSGLAFAGANRRASARPDETDGILSAEEIAGINLDGVDWAVLSACDTGVGEIKVGEGVFGLRRAFQVAGAKTVIMSLWQVEDETTRQWMGTLYREHFLNGKDTGESVRAASLQILRQRRAKHQSTHPFYWGAFIAAGDWH